jgi:hypothetical protein
MHIFDYSKGDRQRHVPLLMGLVALLLLALPAFGQQNYVTRF